MQMHQLSRSRRRFGFDSGDGGFTASKTAGTIVPPYHRCTRVALFPQLPHIDGYLRRCKNWLENSFQCVSLTEVKQGELRSTSAAYVSRLVGSNFSCRPRPRTYDGTPPDFPTRSRYWTDRRPFSVPSTTSWHVTPTR